MGAAVCRGRERCAAEQNKTDDDRFHLGLGGLHCLLHAEKSKVGSRLPSQGRVFLTVLCFESTRT